MRRRRDGTEVRAVGVRAGGAGVWATAIKGNAAWRAALKKERTIVCGCRTIGRGCRTIGCGCCAIGCGCRIIGRQKIPRKEIGRGCRTIVCGCRVIGRSCRTIECGCCTVGKRGGWGRNGIVAGMPFLRYRWSQRRAGDSPAARVHLYYILVSHGRAVYFIVEMGERPTAALAPASGTEQSPRLRQQSPGSGMASYSRNAVEAAGNRRTCSESVLLR